MGTGDWKVDKADKVDKVDSYYDALCPCPMPYALCPCPMPHAPSS
ncbi:histidine kinase [Nostoc sp. CMAA1605]|nr:histidine kinase [Nostoc sp. CMAA1605]